MWSDCSLWKRKCECVQYHFNLRPLYVQYSVPLTKNVIRRLVPPRRGKLRKLTSVSLPLFTFSSYTANRQCFPWRTSYTAACLSSPWQQALNCTDLALIRLHSSCISFIVVCFVLVHASCRTKFAVRFLAPCSYFPWEFLEVFTGILLQQGTEREKKRRKKEKNKINK